MKTVIVIKMQNVGVSDESLIQRKKNVKSAINFIRLYLITLFQKQN